MKSSKQVEALMIMRGGSTKYGSSESQTHDRSNIMVSKAIISSSGGRQLHDR